MILCADDDISEARTNDLFPFFHDTASSGCPLTLVIIKLPYDYNEYNCVVVIWQLYTAVFHSILNRYLFIYLHMIQLPSLQKLLLYITLSLTHFLSVTSLSVSPLFFSVSVSVFYSRNSWCCAFLNIHMWLTIEWLCIPSIFLQLWVLPFLDVWESCSNVHFLFWSLLPYLSNNLMWRL